MIWILLIATALVAVVFLFGPLLKGDSASTSKPIMAGIAALSMAAIIGIYSQFGRPDLTGENLTESAVKPIAQNTEQAAPQTASGHELVTKLQTRLAETNSKDPDGWRLLARSQMQVGLLDEAMETYETLLEITDNDPAIQAEYEQAQKFVQRQAMAVQAQSMTPEDRQAMIKNMVDGLAERLYTDGGPPEEWAKLIRARGVLKEDELLAADIERMKKAFEGQPDVIKQILGGE